ncbi:hypothetical protein C2E23DRAFT_181913 [Lenzites betulinus]|nr:hypothetical protein C2E23DRAFT_181913 [Lenzites betulinus]
MINTPTLCCLPCLHGHIGCAHVPGRREARVPLLVCAFGAGDAPADHENMYVPCWDLMTMLSYVESAYYHTWCQLLIQMPCDEGPPRFLYPDQTEAVHVGWARSPAFSSVTRMQRAALQYTEDRRPSRHLIILAAPRQPVARMEPLQQVSLAIRMRCSGKSVHRHCVSVSHLYCPFFTATPPLSQSRVPHVGYLSSVATCLPSFSPVDPDIPPLSSACTTLVPQSLFIGESRQTRQNTLY